MSTPAEDLLKGVYLFKNFDPAELALVAAIAKPASLTAGDTLFCEGDEAKALYVVRVGTLKIQTATKEGDDVALVTVGSGNHLGELPFFDGDRRTATVASAEMTDLLEIAYTDLDRTLSAHPTMAMKFYKGISAYLAKRLRYLTSDFTQAKEFQKKHF